MSPVDDVPPRDAGSALTRTIGRSRFLLWGLGLFAVKALVDTFVAEGLMHRPWSLRYYLSHEQVALLLSGGEEDRAFFGVMLLIALPFVIAGIVLTNRRLRSAGWPMWMVILFFVPVVHLFFFIALCVAPDKGACEPVRDGGALAAGRIGRVIPRGRWASAMTAWVVTLVLGLGLTAFNVYALGVYGLGLFVGLPFCLGLIAVVIQGYHGVTGARSAVSTAVGCVVLVGGGMIVGAMEGAMCIVMAAPLWIGVAVLGGLVGLTILMHARDQREAALIAAVLAVALPALMGAERALLAEEPVFAVESAVVIAAPPERVWPGVIEFPPISEPKEWYFRAGIAYPTHAVIKGRGVGAERHCVFSTGSFVEPIEVWDEGRRLAFSVTQNPPALRELSLYDHVEPPHLHGFFTATYGEFRLVPLTDGATRLEGTTWYRHHMRPALYWRLWSDALIHRIHLRVLDHIRAQTELEARNDGA